jgi:hypothetical protein
MYKRLSFATLVRRLSEPRRFIQVLAGPRQTGKTTLARQVMAAMDMPSLYATADEPALQERVWIEQQWETARRRSLGAGRKRKALLVLDEIHKIPGWSETVKRLWDEDSLSSLPLQVALLGSSPWLVQRGLTESLAGRFELVPVTHWSCAEMRAAFGWNLDNYLYYGGYPGAARLIRSPWRWRRYILDSLIETSVARDVLLMTRVDKPALLRRLFQLACSYSGQILSYQKMLGQLQDVGNATTLAHYLHLLHGAGLIAGLPKYSGKAVCQRASSPKLLVLNTALMTVNSGLTFKQAHHDNEFWGRLVESAAGASLANGACGKDIELFYWSGANREVDYVLRRGKTLVAIEIKSGRRKASLRGMETFCRQFPVKRKLLVGPSGISLEEFLLTPVDAWLK